jgi:hypothetical protein
LILQVSRNVDYGHENENLAAWYKKPLPQFSSLESLFQKTPV